MNKVKLVSSSAPSSKKNFRTIKQEEPLIVTRRPHIRASNSIAGKMWTTILALVPVIAGAVIVSGFQSLWVIVHAAVSAIIFEFAAEKLFNRSVRIWDGSAILIGLLLGLNLPASAPWWMVWTGTFVAIFVARELSGGLANNRFNVTLFGLAVLFFLFPTMMIGEASLIQNIISIVTISAAGIYLVFKRLILWQSAILFLPMMFAGVPVSFAIFAAVFFVTDSVTTPLTIQGRMLFVALSGLAALLFQFYVSPVEAVIFGILVMNFFVPVVDKYVTITPVRTQY